MPFRAMPALLLIALVGSGCGTTPGPSASRATDAARVVVPLRVEDSKLLTKVEVNGHSFLASIDTGATHTIVDLAQAEAMGMRIAEVESGATVTGVGAYTGRVRAVKADRLSIGRLMIRDLWLVGLDLADAPVWAENRDFVIIGMDVLSANRAIVDLEERELRFP